MDRIKGSKQGVNRVIDLNAKILERSDRNPTDVSNVQSGVRRQSDLIMDGLDKPAKLAGQSSIPPRAETNAKIFRLTRGSGTGPKSIRKARPKKARPNVRPARREHDGIIADPRERNIVPSIAGGTVSETNLAGQEDAVKRAKDNGYLGVYRIYETIKQTLPEQLTMEDMSHEQRMETLAKRIKSAVKELQDLSDLVQTEEGKEMFGTEDPRDVRLFNAVASVLIRIWGHNAQNKLDDARVKSMVHLISDGNVTWRKLIDILAEWEKVRPQLRKGSWGRQ